MDLLRAAVSRMHSKVIPPSRTGGRTADGHKCQRHNTHTHTHATQTSSRLDVQDLPFALARHDPGLPHVPWAKNLSVAKIWRGAILLASYESPLD